MTHRGNVLLVDDEEKILRALGRALRDAGHSVVETASPRHAQRLLGERTFDALIVDNMMPELTGLELIREYVGSTPESERAQILMMTAHATVESAIEAMKLGALDYLQKPFEIDELLVVVRRALEHQRLRTDYRYLVSERDEAFDHYGIIARSTSMEEVIRRAELVAETKSTVLITGETGTGKDAPRIRALRTCPRRIYGRNDDQEGQVRARRRRNDLPGRDRHHESDAAVEAVARAAGARGRTARIGAR